MSFSGYFLPLMTNLTLQTTIKANPKSEATFWDFERNWYLMVASSSLKNISLECRICLTKTGKGETWHNPPYRFPILLSLYSRFMPVVELLPRHLCMNNHPNGNCGSVSISFFSHYMHVVRSSSSLFRFILFRLWNRYCCPLIVCSRVLNVLYARLWEPCFCEDNNISSHTVCISPLSKVSKRWTY